MNQPKFHFRFKQNQSSQDIVKLLRAKTATGVARDNKNDSKEIELTVESISGSSLGSVSSSKSGSTKVTGGHSRGQPRGYRSTKSAIVRSLKSRTSSAATSTMLQRQVYERKVNLKLV